MILDPSWVSYAPMILLHRANPVRVPLAGEDHFRVTADGSNNTSRRAPSC
jgi:aspartate/methionine/tyrosine aminotransferase